MDIVKYEQQASIAAPNPADAAMLEIITYDLMPEFQKKSDEKVIAFYWENFKMYRGKVSIEDVLQDVTNYNEDLLTTASAYYYDTGYYMSDYYSGTREEIIAELASNEMEAISYEFFDHIDAYIEEVLLKNKLGFAYSSYQDIYSEFQNDEVIILYDSQNFLLEELYRIGFKYAEGDCCDYMKTRIIPYDVEEESK